jgi:hypothetical protein
MHNTVDKRYRDGFAAFMESTNKGDRADLKESLGSAFDTLEKDFAEFIGGM